MKYHNEKITFRLTGKQRLVFSRLAELFGHKNATDLVRLALGVLWEMKKKDIRPEDRDDALSGFWAREFVDKFVASCRTFPPAPPGAPPAPAGGVGQKPQTPLIVAARKKRSAASTV